MKAETRGSVSWSASFTVMGKPAKAREPHAHHRCRWNDLERDLLVVESFTMNALLGDPSHTENVVDRRDHFRINSSEKPN